MKSLIVEPCHSPFSYLLCPNIRLRILFSNTLSLHSSLNVRDHVLQPCLQIEITYLVSLGVTSPSAFDGFLDQDYRYTQ